MKQIITTLSCAVAFMCATTYTQAEIYLNYGNDAIRAGFTNSNASATVSAAVAYTPEKMGQQAGYSIHAIDFGLNDVSKLSSLKVWMRHHLSDTDNLLEWTLDASAMADGWNRIELETPINLAQQNDTLYFGYDYTQSAKSAKVVGVTGSKTANAIFGAANGKWKDYSSTYSPLAFRGVLIGNEPYDVALLDLYTTNRTQLVDKGEAVEPLHVKGVFENHGYETITRVTIVWDNENISDSTTVDCQLTPSERMEFVFDYQPEVNCMDNNKLDVRLELSDIVESKQDDNNGRVYFERFDMEYGSLSRQSILLEQFTSLNNGFASEGLEHCRQAVAALKRDPELKDIDVIPLVQHNGYGPNDGLRVSEGNPYKAEAIFADGLQFAPAVSIDHRAVMSTTLPVDSIVRVVKETWNNSHSFTFIEAHARVEEVSLKVDAEFFPLTVAWCDEPRIVVCVVEKTFNSGDSQKDYSEYPHQEENVVSRYLTPTAGESLTEHAGSALTTAQLDDMRLGRTPRYEAIAQKSWSVLLPEGVDISDYAVVIYVCEMSDDSQRVDAVTRIAIEQ